MQSSGQDAVRGWGDKATAPRVPVEVDALAPLLAGARARGIADGLELLGLAAVLVDQSGTVLHVGSCAGKLLGAEITVACRHLVGATSATNQMLQGLIGGAVAHEGAPAPSPIAVPRRGQSPLRVRAVRVPGAAGDPMQLLKAIVILEETETSEAADQDSSLQSG